tara:strand:- start:875 stop:1087 length:213 start_codon:yes stop_codon:yes gene_type:complete
MSNGEEEPLSPCESDPMIRELLLKSVLLDLSQGYRFLIEYDTEDNPEMVHDAESIVQAICAERRVIRLAP